jgi:hypothetical protein
MSTLATLADDLLILVCRYLTLQDVFQLRQTCHRFAAFILSNVNHISLLVARNTFPDTDRLWKVQRGSTRDFLWLKSLVPKYLAAVLVDKYRLVSPDIHLDEFGIPAESERGDGPRARVESGLRVLKKLSDISQDVYRLPESHIPNKPLKERIIRAIKLQNFLADRKRLDLIERRETLIGLRRQSYLNELDSEEVVQYSLMFQLLLKVFKTNHDPASARISHFNYFKYVGPDAFDWAGSAGKRMRQGDSWVLWFIFHQGPMLFWRQWYGKTDEHAVKEAMLRAWNERSSEQIEIERNASLGTGATLRSISKDVYSSSLDILVLFRLYFTYRLAHLRIGDFTPPREIMDDVPFWIDFRTQ